MGGDSLDKAHPLQDGRHDVPPVDQTPSSYLGRSGLWAELVMLLIHRPFSLHRRELGAFWRPPSSELWWIDGRWPVFCLHIREYVRVLIVVPLWIADCHGQFPPWMSSERGACDAALALPPSSVGHEAGSGSTSVESSPLREDPPRCGLQPTGDEPRRPCDGRPRGRWRIVTWLILPVVICLSQRLSHACLSISNYTAKLRMAH
jgi:hypothetical protein